MNNRPASTLAGLAALACASLAGCSAPTYGTAAPSGYGMGTTAPAPAVAVVTPAPAAAMGAPAGTFSAADRDFALVAASSNMFEVGASQIAPKRTASADVLSYASMINRDHTTAMNELMGIMRSRSMAIPQDMAPDKRHLMDTLGTTRDAEFDRTFIIEAGVKAHQADIAAFQQQMPGLSDPALKDWAARTLPVMQQHLAAAQTLASQAG